MKKLFTMLMTFLAISSFAQTKTFSGDYPLSGDFFWVKGKANYAYTEKADYTKVKNGAFSFSADMNGTEFGQSSRARFVESVKGQYKNNLKDGLWTHIITMTNIEQQNATITTTVNYKDGIPNGAWKMTVTDNKTFAVNESISLNFKNGVITGAYNANESSRGITINGACDENGFFHGKQSDVEYGTETITEYTHGKQTLSLNRNVQSGEVSNRKTTDAADLEMTDKITALAKTNPDALADQSFGVDDLYDKELDKYFGQKFVFGLQINDFPGDAMYNTNNSYRFDWKGFRYLTLYKQLTRAEIAAKEAEKAKAEAERQAKLAIERAADELKEQVNNLKYENNAKRDELIKKYSFGTTLPSAENPVARKTPIFKAFIAIETLYNEKENASKDNSEKLKNLESVNKLYNRTIELLNVDTKEMEKLLKKTTDNAEREKLMGL
jgi:hypothetical protein